MKTYLVKAIFATIQGEGFHAVHRVSEISEEHDFVVITYSIGGKTK